MYSDQLSMHYDIQWANQKSMCSLKRVLPVRHHVQLKPLSPNLLTYDFSVFFY